MQESALYVEHIELAQERLEQLLREYQADDRFAPVTVVVPTTYAGLYLRRDIGRRGLVNVRFMVLARLAELLGAQSLAASGQRPLKPLIEFAAVRRAARAAAGQLEPFRDHPSFHASLRATFRDLRYAAPDTRAHLERQGGIPGEIVRLYAHFRDLTASYYGPEELADAAADAVKSGQAKALRDFGRVIAYLPRDLTPGERRLLEALRSARVCATVLGATGDEEADEDIFASVAPRGKCLSIPRDRAPLLRRESRLLIASDIREEVRSVVRAVAAAAHAGTPFQRTAVLYWQREPYASLIAEQFAIAEVPTAGPSAGRLAATAVGRMVKGMVELAGGDLSRDDVMRWLTSCPVKAGAAGYSPSGWDALSREAGVVAGIAQWRDRLAGYATSREQTGEDLNEEVPEARRTRMEQSVKEARALQAFLLRLHENLTQAESCRRWADFLKWADGLIKRYLDEAALPPAEAENLDKLQAALQELAALDGKEDVTLDDFRAALDETLKNSAARSGALGEGVFVGPVRSAVGMRFDRVYLVGMVEGLVPSRPSDDPLLPERERALAGLPTRRAAAAERYDYLAAAAAGRASVLTFARSNNIAQREQRPSLWFLEEASRLYGSPVYPSMLSSPDEFASLRQQPWFEEVASAQAGISGVSGSQSADLHDYDLHRLWRWRRAGKRIGAHHLAAPESVLARASGMQPARRGRTLTIWDGDLSQSSSTPGCIGLSNGEIFSPTRLETWATCPFRYFLSNVLGIAALEQPEEIATISSMDRGSVIHKTLERFIRAAQEQGTIPQPDQPWSADHGRLLMGIAEEEFQDAERHGITGKQFLWEMAQEEIRSDLHRFLEEDFKLRKKYKVSPHLIEASFGPVRQARGSAPVQEPVEWSSPKTGALRFRGFIDRIDLSPGGDTALVLDYKTGGTNAYKNMDKDPVQGGKRLQLPVYGLAARQLLGEEVDVQVAYWFVSEKGKFVTRPPRKAAILEEMLDPFENVVGTIADGIGKGLFPANPGANGENCRYCDFKNLCPTRRERHWRQKRGDRRLAAYAALSDGEGSA